MNNRVVASVFASKLTNLVNALKSADQIVNGGRRHEFTIVDLAAQSAFVSLREQRVSTRPTSGSSVPAFAECVKAVREGDTQTGRVYSDCITQLKSLCRGVEKDYSHGELWVGDSEPVRIDGFFDKQVTRLLEKLKDEAKNGRFFEGAVHGSFDGLIKEVDLRGSTPRVKLILSAGGREIDCVCRSIDVEEIREALNRRVWVDGRTFYDGTGGLPSRLEISNIKQMGDTPDMLRWKGSFTAFEADAWEGHE